MIRHRLIAILAVAAALTLPACSTSRQAQVAKATPVVATAARTVAVDAQGITTGVDSLPARIRQDLAGFAQKHPEMVGAFAKALNDGAGFLADLPSPATLNTLLFWTRFDPAWASAASAFEGIYSASYSTLPAGTNTLRALAQVLQQTPSGTTQTAVV